MSIINKLLGNDQEAFELRYVESVDEWEVLDNSGVVYMGSKRNCNTFIQTCTWLKNTGKTRLSE